ncbi:hypothetical protein [Lactiplantibacillus daowaiensis]|uniref:Uncharacterized protein n=1 Tax=Lactiplantibacillus daowaiensis TaxID=2559918 RepID=A0ABW1RWD8_9LACO|nr:hypothetical protein [Lactiplantibacillus daowaiensis]
MKKTNKLELVSEVYTINGYVQPKELTPGLAFAVLLIALVAFVQFYCFLAFGIGKLDLLSVGPICLDLVRNGAAFMTEQSNSCEIVKDLAGGVSTEHGVMCALYPLFITIFGNYLSDFSVSVIDFIIINFILFITVGIYLKKRNQKRSYSML